MQIIHSIADLRKALRGRPAPAFIPTMGNLHEGHMALVASAVTLGGPVVASVFVNRLQFLPHEDFDQYPRTLEADAAKLQAAGCDILFAPSERDMYREPQTFRVNPDPVLADILEGSFRPGFFTGVCTVVMKLFHCVQPRVAVFGKKDYQQLMVVRAMVNQLAMQIQVVGCDTTRDHDGLALSSRNAYLTSSERTEAPRMFQVLSRVASTVRAGAAPQEAQFAGLQELVRHGWQPDYIEVRSCTGLRAPSNDDAPLVVLGAARLGKTRLLDNIEF